MSDLQVTQEVVVELDKFYNVDLFQRGYYQLRCHIRNPPKTYSVITCKLSEEREDLKTTVCLFKSFVDQHTSTGISKTFEVYYKHEEVFIKDQFVFKIEMLVDGAKLESQLLGKINLVVELFFTECTRKYPATPKSLEEVSSREIILNLSPSHSFHAHRPIIFDYFHLGAVNLTVHSGVTAVRQPWLAALKALHPVWGGKSGNVRQLCYTNLFGKNPPTSSSQKLDNRQKSNASFCHRKLVLSLLKLYDSLLTYYHECIVLLPEFAQTGFSKIDISTKLDVLNSEFDLLCTAEENYLRMGDDLYLLSAELSMLWQQFFEKFTFQDTLVSKLAKLHQTERLERMREAVFTEEHSWEALCSSHELTTSQHSRLSSAVKSSLYYSLIPTLSLHCVSLDADVSSFPIIFEDKYVPGKKIEEIDKEDNVSITVEECIVDDFVDMDVSIEETKNLIKRIAEEEGTDSDGGMVMEENGIDTLSRKSKLVKKFQSSYSVDWDFSPSMFAQPMKETNLTGEDFSNSHNTFESPNNFPNKNTFVNPYKDSKKSRDSDNIKSGQTKSKKNTLKKQMSLPVYGTREKQFSRHYSIQIKNSPLSTPKKYMVNDSVKTSIFYREIDETDNAENGNDCLIIDKLKDKKTSNAKEIIELASPSEPPKPKLWSCFPALKSKKNSYNMLSPYQPMPKENLSRFKRAKENLEYSFNFPYHHYKHLAREINVKEYFTDRVLATADNVHLIVCVHGLDGNRDDLRLVKCYLEMAAPQANFDFLMSEVNQDDTFKDIDEMTALLVREIKDYIEEQKIEISKISFIGHSLGTIIIRNAVVHSHLFEYRVKLHTFLSLSGPHLGMQFHTSNLVSTGMWLMQKWKKGGSLVQLALNDASDPRDSFMYRLSLTNGFQYFKNVLLVSSVQDHYVPFHSARVEMSKQVLKGSTDNGRVYKEMLDNIMTPLMVQEEVNIVRYSVYHPMASSTDSFIGRAAHIAMLDSEIFLEKFILVAASEYFK